MLHALCLHDNRDYWIRLEGDQAVELSAAPWDHTARDVRRFPFDPTVSFWPPCAPTKIVCVGKNYREHVKELHPGEEAPAEPLIFLKPPSALLESGGAIIMPPESQRVDYEGELGVVIGCRLSRPNLDEARAGIFGYVPANDVTARDLQKKDGQWTRAKGFDTFCPLGPHVETDVDPAGLNISLSVNGRVKQTSSTALMIRTVEEIISFVSQVMTLLPGDVVLTGTPPGVGPVAIGDVVEVEIEGIGSLRNKVT